MEQGRRQPEPRPNTKKQRRAQAPHITQIKGNQPVSRRDMLKAIVPGGWIPEAIRGGLGGLSTPAQISLVKDAALLLGTAGVVFVETQSKPDEGKRRLNEELDRLSDSPIKSLLAARVKPFFGSNPPKSVTYDGLDIKVSNPTVVLKTVNTDSASGVYTPRDSSFSTLEPLYPTKEVTLKIPYLGLVSDSEKATIPAANLASDGTPLIDMNFPVDKPFYEGITPVITITTPDSSFIKSADKQLFKNFERFGYVKEACSMLLLDIYFEETVKEMHALGLNITMETRAKNGTVRQAEGLVQSLTVLHNAGGRIAASIDLAAYLLAFKALEGVDINYSYTMDQGVRQSMQAVSLGTSAQDILFNSFRWVLGTPDASKQLDHFGNIANIP